MKQTEDYGRRHRGKWLNDKQHAAIRLLVSGLNDEEAAKAAGVSRQTLNKWKNNNALFISELSQKRAEAWKEFVSPLTESVRLAMDAVHTAIKNGDVKASIWLLERAGIEEQLREEISAQKAKPRTIEDIIPAIAARRAEKRLEALRLNPYEELGSGQDIKQEYYREELESIRREYGVDD